MGDMGNWEEGIFADGIGIDIGYGGLVGFLMLCYDVYVGIWLSVTLRWDGINNHVVIDRLG